jgi:hypothetical protein
VGRTIPSFRIALAMEKEEEYAASTDGHFGCWQKD